MNIKKRLVKLKEKIFIDNPKIKPYIKGCVYFIGGYLFIPFILIGYGHWDVSKFDPSINFLNFIMFIMFIIGLFKKLKYEKKLEKPKQKYSGVEVEFD